MSARKTERVVIGVLAVGVLLALARAAQTQEKDEKDLWVVSIRHLVLAPGERVIGFDVQIQSARVTALLKVPPLWDIKIENDPLWTVKVAGRIEMGSAAINGEFWGDFLVIRKWTAEDLGGISPPPFNITMEITTTVDFASAKRVLLGKEDLLLRKR